jgi:energy-coupling factor transporter ATP-binding protein EcfA2
MTGQLLIDEVYAERFGGLSNTGLALGGQGLVVVHGPNESGKTTLASLLAWLLVGPTGTREGALRFGQPNDQLSGRLTGSLNGQALRIDGTFKLLQRGLPNATGITAQYAGHKLDLDAWRTTIGGIDPKVLTATYRMWGADLHTDDDVVAEITQAALAGLGGAQRMGDVVATLHKQALDHLSARGEGAESFSTLGVRRSGLEADIKAIGANASTYLQHQDAMAHVAEKLQAILVQASQLSTHVAAIRALQSVTKERHRERAITDELADLATVPPLWLPLVDPVEPFITTAQAADVAVDAARTAELAVRAAAAQAGLDDAQAEQLRVTHATVTSVQVTLNRLDHARMAQQSADNALRSAGEAAAIAEAEARRTLATCPEVQGDTLATRPLAETDVRGVRTFVADWATAERQVVGAHTAVSAAQTRVEIATGTRDTAQDQWDRLGTGVTAQQWRATPPAVTTPPTVTATSPTTGRPWLPVAIAGAVALAAVLVLPRWVAVGITAAAFAGAVLMLRRTPTLVPTPDSAVPVVTVDPAVETERLDAANTVIAAQLGLDQATVERQRLQADLSRLQRDLEHPRQAVATECQRLGMVVGDTPAATADLIDRALAASAAVATLATAQQAQAQARRSLEVASHDMTAVLADLCSTLADAGVPPHLPCEQTAAGVDTLRQLTDLVAHHHVAQRVADEAQQAFQALIEPLGPAAAERNRASLMTEAQQFAALHAERTRLEAERAGLEHDITMQLREHPAAKDLAAQRRSDSEWDAELALRLDELAQAERDRDDLNRRLGELRQTMDQLMNSDELAQKRLELGMVTERADEQLLAGVVAVAARSLLGQVAAERRRNHQPALVARAGSLLASVASDWQQLLVDPTDNGSAEVTVVDAAGVELATSRLSTGARALTHLALRLATAELDAERRRVRFPIICDDPLVHLDDDRAQAVMPLLARAAADGHQVIVFTCHGRTVDAARTVGARVVQLA